VEDALYEPRIAYSQKSGRLWISKQKVLDEIEKVKIDSRRPLTCTPGKKLGIPLVDTDALTPPESEPELITIRTGPPENCPLCIACRIRADTERGG
jgi:hypothetical protein